uniref:Uncharacterized protein n=1 Tax=uncultured virus TaxID=340016 RepID=D5L2E0_9VIRU|nr:hypothetical protein [uncultured virus]
MVSFQRIINRLPSITPRDADKNIVKYTDAFTNELNEFGNDITSVQESRFIDQASSKELDQLANQYGILGSRDGRTDDEYRQYLKSLVPIFRFQGTVPGIRAAVAAGLDLNDGLNGGTQDLFVKEHFEDDPPTDEEHLEYTLIFENWTKHNGQTVEELAELSDSSMSRLRQPQYNIGKDTTTVSDNVTIEEAINIPNPTSVTDTIIIDNNRVVWNSGNWNSMHWQ